MVPHDPPTNSGDSKNSAVQDGSPLPSPPIFAPAELRKFSGLSLSPQDWAKLNKWEDAESNRWAELCPGDDVPTGGDATSPIPLGRRKGSTIVTVETEQWSRDHDPANSDSFDDAVSPRDKRRFSHAVHRASRVETFFLRGEFTGRQTVPLPVRPSLNPFQPGPPLKAAAIPPQETSVSDRRGRNDTRVSRFSDHAACEPDVKPGPDSVTTSPTDKPRRDSRDLRQHDSRCGVLPSLPESVNEESIRTMTGTHYRVSGDPLEQDVDIWNYGADTAYDTMIRIRKSQAQAHADERARRAANPVPQTVAPEHETRPRRGDADRARRERTIIVVTWWAANLHFLCSAVGCLGYGVLQASPSAVPALVVLGAVSACMWLVLMSAAWVWQRRQAEPTSAAEDLERRPLLAAPTGSATRAPEGPR